jgi:hypothetical protein
MRNPQLSAQVFGFLFQTVALIFCSGSGLRTPKADGGTFDLTDDGWHDMPEMAPNPFSRA